MPNGWKFSRTQIRTFILSEGKVIFAIEDGSILEALHDQFDCHILCILFKSIRLTHIKKM